MENAQHEKGRKCTYWKMTENHNQKMKEWKMHDMEKGRKCTPRKMTEKSQLENERMENAQHEKGRKCTYWKMTKTATPTTTTTTTGTSSIQLGFESWEVHDGCYENVDHLNLNGELLQSQ